MAMHIVLDHINDWLIVHLRGSMDESAAIHLRRLFELNANNVAFNFRAVNGINSSGVRSWISFIRSFCENRNVIYVEATPIVVMQLNMVPSFMHNCEVHSVYGSYACESCNLNQMVKFVTGENMPKADESVPEFLCPRCNRAMEFEEEEGYFDFNT